MLEGGEEKGREADIQPCYMLHGYVGEKEREEMAGYVTFLCGCAGRKDRMRGEGRQRRKGRKRKEGRQTCSPDIRVLS